MTGAPLLLLYQLRPIDETQAFWAPVHFYQSSTGSAANPVNSGLQSPPNDKIWFITRVAQQAIPAAGVTALNLELRVADAVSGIVEAIIGNKLNNGTLRAVGESVVYVQHCDVLLVGGVHALNARWQFDVGNAANVVRWSYMGYQVPKANVALS